MQPVFRCVFLLLFVFLSQSQAAKVVRLYNAWPDSGYAFSVCGWWNGTGWNGPGTAGSFPSQVDGWYSLTLPTTYDATKPVSQSGIFFAKTDWSVSYDKSGLGKGQTFLDIASVLKTSDTVWIIPTPLPNGAPILTGVRPRQTTVMVLNPWASDSNPAASFQNDEGAWSPMKPSKVHTEGWISSTLMGHTHLRPLVRNAAGTSYFGTTGLSPLPIPMELDSLLEEDTVWIRPAPEPNGAAKVERTKPTPKILMLLNPWNGLIPIQSPRISFDGAKFLPMSPVSGYCGWFRYAWYERTGTPLFRAGNGQTFGLTGIGGTEGFEIATTLATQDTVWISQSAGESAPVVRGFYGGATGLCNIALLAATVRDFDGSHPDFQKGWNGVQKNMILPNLDVNRKPINNPLVFNRISGDPIGTAKMGDTIDTRISVDWFNTVPGVNTETCRDIPLELDSATGSYIYDNPQYFPIDDFKTLPDGSPNPRLNLIAGSGGILHNYSFCLESHGEFDYRKGQTFNFRGDDDVWFFIDNRLVVDLGGVHGASSSTVKLDTIGVTENKGLTEGNTYKFDFFFCERYATGSSLRIQTDMNMRTRSGFQVQEIPTADGKKQFDLLTSQSRGQGCAATDKVTKATGSFRLLGPAFATARLLPSGLHYGGILIDAEGTHASMDSASIAGLPPGTYILRAVSNIDTTQTVDIPFVVPFLARPKFVSTLPRTDMVGTSFAVDIGAFKPAGVDSSNIRFVLSSTPGIRFFRDSLLTSPLDTADTLMTGANGAHRRVWVRGDLAGTYTLVVGAIPGDTSHTYPLVTFTARGLRFLDSALTPIPAPWPLIQDPKDTVDFRLEAWTVGARCAKCTDVLDFTATTPGLVILDTNNAPVTSLQLAQGYTALRLVASRTVRGGQLVVRGDQGDTLIWSPISFLPPRLAFVDASGKELDSLVRSTLAGTRQGPLSLEVRGAQGLCTSCEGRIAIQANAPGIAIFADSLGTALDSLSVIAGKTQFWVSSPLQILDLRLIATSPVYDPDTLSGPAFRIEPPSGGYVLDTDGDGRADSVILELRSPFAATDSLRFTWPTQEGESRWASAATVQSLASGLGGFAVTPWAYGKTGCHDLGCADLGLWRGRDAHGALLESRFPLRDSVPPVAVRALLRFSADGLVPDTLEVWFSEPLRTGPGIDWLAWGRASLSSQGTAIVPATASLVDSGTRALLILTADSTIGKRRGDSVRIAATGALLDLSGIASPLRTAWVPLEFGPRAYNFTMGSYPAVRRVPVATTPPPGEAGLQALIRVPGTGAWQTLDGKTVTDTSRLGGLWIETNQPLRGKLFVYDNLGIHVASLDLAPLEAAFSSGDLERAALLDSRGRGRFWLAWNGTSDRGNLVSTGVYTFRVVTWQGTATEPRWSNRLLRIGWHRAD